MSQRIVDLVAGIAPAFAMLMLAWLVTVLPEEPRPSPNRLLAWTRSRRGRRIIAAVMVVMAVVVLVLPLINFLAE